MIRSVPLPSSSAGAGRWSSRRRPGRGGRLSFIENQRNKSSNPPREGRAGPGGAERRARCGGDADTPQKPKPRCPGAHRRCGFGPSPPPERQRLVSGRGLPAPLGRARRGRAVAPGARPGGTCERLAGPGGADLNLQRKGSGPCGSGAARVAAGAAPALPEQHRCWSSGPATAVFSNWT